MGVGKYHFLHGSVLAQIVRRERLIALTLIETNEDSWSAYRLNDEVLLYIKSSQSPKELVRRGSLKWLFTFSKDHIKTIKGISENKPLFLALVCAGKSLDDKTREICLLEPEQVLQCLDLDNYANQWITVEMIPGNSLRAYGNKNSSDRNKLVISRKKLDSWEIPGT